MEPYFQQSVAEWLRVNDFPVTGLTLSSAGRQAEARAVEKLTGGIVELPPTGYRAYDYGLSRAVAHNLAACQGALAAGFTARLTGSGMQAIQLALAASGIADGQTLFHGDVLYPETPKFFDDLGRYGIRIQSIRSGDMGHWPLDVHDGKVIFLETVGNGPTMPIISPHEIFASLWDDPITIILDNTLPSGVNWPVFENYLDVWGAMGKRKTQKMRLIVVESLSKFYRCTPEDTSTGGVIFVPNDMVAETDALMARMRTYMPLPVLLQFPVDLYDAALDLHRRLQPVYLFVGGYLATKLGAAEIRAAGCGVLFFPVPQCLTVEETMAVMERAVIPQRSSFGHPETTYIPWGRVDPSMPNVVRLSVGWQDDMEEVVGRLSRLFS
jgi:hypothetical protein